MRGFLNKIKSIFKIGSSVCNDKIISVATEGILGPQKGADKF